MELVEEMHETEWKRTERQDGMWWDGMGWVGMVKILVGSYQNKTLPHRRNKSLYR